MLGLRYFTILCNDAEYKNMDQGESQGQLYDVQNWIKIYYKQPGWAYSFSTTLSLCGKVKRHTDKTYKDFTYYLFYFTLLYL
jgi:hypothetical protein